MLRLPNLPAGIEYATRWMRCDPTCRYTLAERTDRRRRDVFVKRPRDPCRYTHATTESCFGRVSRVSGVLRRNRQDRTEQASEQASEQANGRVSLSSCWYNNAWCYRFFIYQDRVAFKPVTGLRPHGTPPDAFYACWFAFWDRTTRWWW